MCSIAAQTNAGTARSAGEFSVGVASQSPAGLPHHSVLSQSPKGMTVSGLQDECQHPGAQADAAAALLYCGAGLPNAYLAITFDQLLLLSMGRSVDLVQDNASSAGNCCIICRVPSAMPM